MKPAIGLALAAQALAALAIGACDATVYQDSATPSLGFGNAVQQNSAVMIIDPFPATAASTDLDLDGRRAAIAVERYKTGKVIPPREMRTSEVLSGSGTSMGGGAQ